MLNLAKSAGFCFGVKKALEVVEELLKQKKKVAVLGNIINNYYVVKSLKAKGVRVLNDVEEALEDEVLVLRSHGVGPEVFLKIKNLNINFKDATCPFVRKIHFKVFEEFKKGKKILIAGNKKHPEVVGILGYCEKTGFVFSNLNELKKIFNEHEALREEEVLVVSQTTFNFKNWNECVEYLKLNCKKLEVFCSICAETIKRQKEAEKFSKISDFCFVVGDKTSSNTNKLFNICSEHCKTFFVEDEKDLENLDVSLKGKTVFITAGASTSNFLITKILKKIEEKMK